ncbi:MAG: DUF3108 domain-containing protein [Pseudobdellovibrio sp.]
MKLLVIFLFLVSCSSSILKYQGDHNITKNTDFENKVKIKGDKVAEDKASEAVKQTDDLIKPVHTETKSPPKIVKAKKSKQDKSILKETLPKIIVPPVRQPEVEDSSGFEAGSRRPMVDPFRAGEIVTHSVSYFSAQAGIMTFTVKPFVEVNNRKSYNFLIDLKSSGIFSNFYSVDDQVETYLDFEDLVPHVFQMHLKESAQLKEAQSYFDQKNLKATYWEHKYTEKKGNEEKKLEWDILAYSQNAFSGIFYMRIFKWEIGKEYSFRVSDNEKNIIFKGTALKKEKLSTDAGEFDAIKIKAQVVSRGLLEQVGDIYIWVSDDDRKYILRVEAKIKIGTVVSEVISIKPGKSQENEK